MFGDINYTITYNVIIRINDDVQINKKQVTTVNIILCIKTIKINTETEAKNKYNRCYQNTERKIFSCCLSGDCYHSMFLYLCY